MILHLPDIFNYDFAQQSHKLINIIYYKDFSSIIIKQMASEYLFFLNIIITAVTLLHFILPTPTQTSCTVTNYNL